MFYSLPLRWLCVQYGCSFLKAICDAAGQKSMTPPNESMEVTSLLVCLPKLHHGFVASLSTNRFTVVTG